MNGQRCVYVDLYSFFNLGSRHGRWSTPRPYPFTPGNNPAPNVQESRWAPGPVWTGANISPPSGFDARTAESAASRYPNHSTQSTSANYKAVT